MLLRVLFLLFTFCFCSLSYAEDVIEYEETKEFVADLTDAYEQFINQRYVLFQHRANYALPLSFNNKPNNAPFDATLDQGLLDERGPYVDQLEAEFQISFKVLTNKNLFGTGVDTFLAYTHRAWWQIYNGSWSKPFRETNYTPELFGRKIFDDPKRILGAYIAGYDFGYMHESNGQSNELSRSWDRIFIRGLWGTRQFRMLTTIWFRIPESSRRDQNPNITDFKGIGEVEFIYQPNRHEFRLIVVPGLSRSGAEFSYSYPLKRDFRIFTKINYGYGQSLLDFDHKVQRVGVGVSLTDPISNFFQNLKKDKPIKSKIISVD